MKYDVSIDKELFGVYSEIRLGILRFHADVKAPDDHFWDYMNTEVLPQVRSCIEGKEWNEIPGIKGSRAAYKAFGRENAIVHVIGEGEHRFYADDSWPYIHKALNSLKK